MKDMGIILMLSILGVAIVVGGISVYFMGPNNPVEKVAEEVVKDETGINLDLTPQPAPVAPQTEPSAQSPSHTTPEPPQASTPPTPTPIE